MYIYVYIVCLYDIDEIYICVLCVDTCLVLQVFRGVRHRKLCLVGLHFPCVCVCVCLCMIIHRSRDSIPQPRHALHTNTYLLYVYDIHTIHICDTIYDICMI